MAKVTDPINLQYTTIKQPLPEFIYAGLQRFSKDANAYKPQPEELIAKLAAKHKVPAEMIYLTAGIDEAIQMFIRAYGEVATVFTPTYTVYGDVELFGNKLNQVYSISEGEYKVEPKEFADSSLVLLANPNNPSGFTSKEKVVELVEKNPQAVVVIDEAYGEFADLSVISEVAGHKNMAVFRSFSKDYAMAGNRIGYVIASSEIIAKVKDMSQWANVSYLSVGAAIVALENEEYFASLRREINAARDELRGFLVDQGFTVLPSHINALLIQFKAEDAGQYFYDYLTESNIITSHGNGKSNIGLDKSFVRIAIGTPEQLEELKRVVKEYSGAK